MTPTLATRLLVAAALAAAGCGRTVEASEPPRELRGLIPCQAPRPEVCTYEHDPVCGLIRTRGICPEAPCKDRIAWRTYSNACTACTDEEVESWKSGRCPADA